MRWAPILNLITAQFGVSEQMFLCTGWCRVCISLRAPVSYSGEFIPQYVIGPARSVTNQSVTP